jgi:hypothetical protein
MPGVLGRIRDAAVRPLVTGMLEGMLPPLNTIRADIGTPPVASANEFVRRAPLILVASGKPFEYPQTDWGEAVQLIGPCVLDDEPERSRTGWRRSSGRSCWSPRPRNDRPTRNLR